jgi:hypothetical protein
MQVAGTHAASGLRFANLEHPDHGRGIHVVAHIELVGASRAPESCKRPRDRRCRTMGLLVAGRSSSRASVAPTSWLLRTTSPRLAARPPSALSRRSCSPVPGRLRASCGSIVGRPRTHLPACLPHDATVKPPGEGDRFGSYVSSSLTARSSTPARVRVPWSAARKWFPMASVKASVLRASTSLGSMTNSANCERR